MKKWYVTETNIYTIDNIITAMTASIHLVVTLQLKSAKSEMTKKSKALEKAEEEVRPYIC